MSILYIPESCQHTLPSIYLFSPEYSLSLFWGNDLFICAIWRERPLMNLGTLK